MNKKINEILEELHKVDNNWVCDEITRNNGIKLHGFCNKMHTVSPIVYFECIPDDVLMSAKSSANYVRKVSEEVDSSQIADMMTEFLSNPEKLQKKVFYKIVNADKNIYKDCIGSIKFLDLLLIPYILIEQSDGGIASFRIASTKIASMLDLSYATVLKNTLKLFPVRKDDIRTLLRRFAPELSEDNRADLDSNVGLKMIVYTNETGINGATSALLSGEIQRDHAACIIIPSSIHEVIVVPYSEKITEQDLIAVSSMVREVNSVCLAPDDFLSNSVYYYNQGESIRVYKGDEHLNEQI